MTQVQPLCLVEPHAADLSSLILLIPVLAAAIWCPETISSPATISSSTRASLCAQAGPSGRKPKPSLAGSLHPSGRSTVTPSLVISENWWKVHLFPSPRLLIKILNRISLNTWRTSLVTGHQLDVTLFTCVLKDEAWLNKCLVSVMSGSSEKTSFWKHLNNCFCHEIAPQNLKLSSEIGPCQIGDY